MPSVLRIEDPADPRLEPYRDVRERDLVGRGRSFIAEGEVVLRRLLGGSRHGLASVLLAEKRLVRLGGALAGLPPDLPVYVAPQPVMDTVVGFHIHRGVLAMGRRAPDPNADELLSGLPPAALVVAAFGIGNHDNMGGIFRNAAAFGADAVLLDRACCDPLYRKSIRVSVGAALTVPFARLPQGGDPIALLRTYGFEPLGLSPSGTTPLIDLRPPERAALLLGPEGPGLAPDLLARARTVAIPMAEGFDSLNVATTSAIALHHLRFAAPR